MLHFHFLKSILLLAHKFCFWPFSEFANCVSQLLGMEIGSHAPLMICWLICWPHAEVGRGSVIYMLQFSGKLNKIMFSKSFSRNDICNCFIEGFPYCTLQALPMKIFMIIIVEDIHNTGYILIPIKMTRTWKIVL